MNELFTMDATRRGFFARGAAMAVGVTALTGMLSSDANAGPTPNLGIPTTTLNLPGTGDTQVVNYALQLEDLEADLYQQAYNRLTTGGTTGTKAASTVGTITGLNLANDANYGPLVSYIGRFLAVEVTHRNYLDAKLGASSIIRVSPQKYDFGISSMNAIQVLNLVLEAEATGVQAYLGAIPYFSNNSQYLPVAAAIQGTEARHTSVLTIVRNILVANGVDTTDPARTPVAPLKGDSGTNPAPQTYSSATPNLGDTNGIDLHLNPTDVVARVGPFLKGPNG